MSRVQGVLVALLMMAGTLIVTPGAQAVPEVVFYEETWNDGCSPERWHAIAQPPVQAGPLPVPAGATGWGTSSSGGVDGTSACHTILRSAGSLPSREGYGTNGRASLLKAAPLDLSGKTMTAFMFSVRGESTPDTDQLFVQVAPAGSNEWVNLAVFSGAIPDFQTVAVTDPSILFPFQGEEIDIRFYFTSDGQPENLPGFTVDNLIVMVEAPVNGGGGGGGGGPTEPPQSVRDMINVTMRLADGSVVQRTHIDLVQDRGRNLAITIDHGRVTEFLNERNPNRYDPDDTFLVGAKVVHPERPSILLQFTHNRADDVYLAILPVNHPDLVVGEWGIEVVAWREVGPLFVEAIGNPLPLEVRIAPSLMPDPISVWLHGFEGHITVQPAQKMGRGDRLDLNVTASQVWPQIQKITYQLSQGNSKSPELPLFFPYRLDVGILSLQGAQQLEIRAYDRARPASSPDGLNVAKIVIPLTVDTVDPAFTTHVPNEVFQGLPFDVQVDVVEQSDFSVRVRFNGSDTVLLGSQQETVYALGRSANLTGKMPLFVEVVDAVGNRASKVLQVNLQQLNVDTVLEKMERTSTVPLMAGDLAAFRATAMQEGGRTAIPADITISGPNYLATQRVELATDASKSIVKGAVFPPGRHVMKASVGVPSWINETNTANQEKEVAFEVFLGRVITTNATYYIRVNDMGTPASAVDLAKDGAVIPLEVAERFNGYCEGSVFVFPVGTQEYCWDPLKRTTDFTKPVEGASGEDDEESPGVGLLVSLALLGAAAVALRRRQR